MLRISGLIPFTTIDYPGLLSSVLFCQGCSWRCGYCHNKHLQPFTEGLISWDAILHFLEERKGFLEAVVFSGGEPTQQKDLDKAIAEIRDMGYKIGLHTAGVYPEGFNKVLPYLDWVGMDIKAPFESYEKITRVPHSGEKAKRCAQMLIGANIPYEFRTTVQPDLLTLEDLRLLVLQISQMGAKNFVLQPVRNKGQEIPEVMNDPFLHQPFLDELKSSFEQFSVR